MPVLYINFSHPVKGTASLKKSGPLKQRVLNIGVDSENSNEVEIPTGQCLPGKWLMTLNWQYDGRSFSYNRPFEVSEKEQIEDHQQQKLLNRATSLSGDSHPLNPVNKLVETLPG